MTILHEQKVETVLRVLDGATSVAQAAEELGVSESEVQEWRRLYMEGLKHACAQQRSGGGFQRTIRLTKRRAAASLAVILLLFAAGVVADPALDDILGCETLDPSFFCFQPNTPAKSSEINHNFAKTAEWVEGAVGPIDAPSVVTSAGVTSIGGDLETAGRASVGGNLEVSGTSSLQNVTSLGFAAGRVTVGDYVIDSADVSTSLPVMNMSLCDCENFGSSNLFQNNAMYECPNGKVITGIYSTGSSQSDCDAMHCLEYYRCCRVCGFAAQP